jgi:hypothetical protein
MAINELTASRWLVPVSTGMWDIWGGGGGGQLCFVSCPIVCHAGSAVHTSVYECAVAAYLLSVFAVVVHLLSVCAVVVYLLSVFAVVVHLLSVCAVAAHLLSVCAVVVHLLSVCAVVVHLLSVCAVLVHLSAYSSSWSIQGAAAADPNAPLLGPSVLESFGFPTDS